MGKVGTIVHFSVNIEMIEIKYSLLQFKVLGSTKRNDNNIRILAISGEKDT